MIQEAYKLFLHLSNDASWCGMLFASRNSTQMAKKILKEGLSKNANNLAKMLPSIPIEDKKAYHNYEYLSERSAQLVKRVETLLKSKCFAEQTTDEEKQLLQTAFNDITQIHNYISK